jgi:TIR domain-containing protein/CobQ/CobB/MinD/ParA family nucleotide binding protein
MMVGRVITFYSYKGGVGRTFALANIGVILAQWGYRVLIVDWDIEAPGLSHYLSEYAPPPTTGVLGFLLDCQRGKPEGWQAYASHVRLSGCPHGIHIMAAASENEDYTGLVQSLDWDELYDKHDFGTRVEQLRHDWVDQFDFVLIDSRTGVTDFSGLTTAQLPDTLAFLFTANIQSLEGCCRIAERAMAARRNLPIDRPALLPLPIVAKFDQREEYDRAQTWRGKFNERLGTFLDIWVPREISRPRLIDFLTIPYVPRWTFGEDLAASIEPRETDGVRTASTPVSYTLETIAAILANGFKKIELLSSSRDEYVLTARTTAQTRVAREGGRRKIFISYARQHADVAEQVKLVMAAANFDLWMDQLSDLPVGEQWSSRTLQEIEQSDCMIAIVGPSDQTSTYQQAEIEGFLRHALRSNVRKPIVPLVLPNGEGAFQKSRLADFNALHIDPERPLSQQLKSVLTRLEPEIAVPLVAS